MTATFPHTATSPARRHRIRSVALPSEHGGWGLTLEPGVLGLIIAPSAAGVCLVVAAVVAFLARTPLKLALVDRRRHRSLPRTQLAWRVAAAEIAVLTALVAVAVVLGDPGLWVPAAMAAPFIAVESWYEVRSRSRRLVPELAGAIGVSSVAAMVLLAGGQEPLLAAGAWLILTARVVTSIPYVRSQIARIRGRTTSITASLVFDTVAVTLAAVAVAIDRQLFAGAVAVAVVVVAQRLMARGEPPRPVILGIRQMTIGFSVAITTAIGVLAAGG